jgi:hypothetical protein
MKWIMEDVVVASSLFAAIWLYRTSIRKNLGNKVSKDQMIHILARFTWLSVVLISYIMCIGILHQMGILKGVAAYLLFVIGGVAALVGLRALRQIMS